MLINVPSHCRFLQLKKLILKSDFFSGAKIENKLDFHSTEKKVSFEWNILKKELFENQQKSFWWIEYFIFGVYIFSATGGQVSTL